MQEKELKIAGGSLFYQIQKNQVCILRWQPDALMGDSGEVCVPAQIEGMPVTALGKKSFLSQKHLRKVILPDTITEVGDWAFAYCSGLREVELPKKTVSFGKSVFLECDALEFLTIRLMVEMAAGCQCSYGKESNPLENGLHSDISGKQDYENATEGMGYSKKRYSEEESEFQGRMTAALLAAAVTVGEAYYLLDICEAGSREWLAKWDARMLAVIHTPDQDGFSKQILCGEEDYGSTDLNAYMSQRRKVKVRLMLLRLLYSYGLDEDIKEELRTYLKNHTKGCDGEEAWEVVLKEHGEDREYYALFAELGCVTEDNLDGILQDIGEEYPEMKAYFMRYKAENIGYGDFFGELEL
ncbi:MAG: leucine-rich repeat domain-containing protein [Bacteroidales bacterium]|nr:leucine-rich repeat domain-containing protein [Lachnoclostridium sp.]MCM1383702.1 leucine-rich repeat domain-containing protein [Lachnoclostridium sp.]MCM1464330.1 leucine-rich repeat domain-containing protein [Bacteroidales bacterium]